MKKSGKFLPDVRERAVRMVQGHRGEYPSLWAAVESIAPRIGCVPQTLLEWVKCSEVGAGNRTESNVLRCYAEGLEPADLYAEDVRQMIGADIGRIVANNHWRPKCILPGYPLSTSLVGYTVVPYGRFTVVSQNEFAGEAAHCINVFADNQGKAPGWCLFLHARCLEAMGEH